jgi:hypothetical protein
MSAPDKARFLSEKVQPYLEPMLADLLAARPECALTFMKKWLSRNGNEIHAEMLNSPERNVEINLIKPAG